jgi:hypothetical protein
LKSTVFLPQGLLILHKLRVDRYAGHRTHLNALGLIKVPHAFGAFMRINLVDFLSKIDRLIRAFRLTDIAVDAFIGNDQCHIHASVTGSKIFKYNFMDAIIGALSHLDSFPYCANRAQHDLTKHPPA